MKAKGPIITLAAGLVAAAVLMVMNLSVTPTSAPTDIENAGNDTFAAAPTTTAPASPAPTVSATAAPVQPAAVGTQVTYAGNVNGNGATLAIAVKDGKAVAYLCDGTSVEAWLQGTASGGQLNLTNPSGGKLTGTFGNGVAAGDVTAAGKQFTFSLKTVAPPSGLYRATADVRNAKLVGGWIVLENGDQVGIMVLGTTVGPASRLNTTTKTTVVNDVTVNVGYVEGSGL